MPQIPCFLLYYTIERKESKHCTTFIFMPLTTILFSIHCIIDQNWAFCNYRKSCEIRHVLKPFQGTHSTLQPGYAFITTPFETSQAPAQTPESATQLEYPTLKLLTLATHRTCHTTNNVTLMPPINVTPTVSR